MNRRNFLTYGIISATPTLGLPLLTGCNSEGSNSTVENIVQPSCTTSSFSLGLNFASNEMLSNISSLSASAYAGGQLENIPSSDIPVPKYFDLSDTSEMAKYGMQSKVLPDPHLQGQGRLGSCVAWGVGYAMGSFLNAYSKGVLSQSPSNQVSPADLYAKILRLERGNACGNGTYIKDALDIFVYEGVSSLSVSPYSDSICFSPSNNSQFFIDGYHKIQATDYKSIKVALSSFNVLPFGMNVYSDFQKISGPNVYSHSDTSCPLGGHCMALVGYDDARGAYRVMNSWGKDWGDKGFAWIAYETFNRIAMEVYIPYIHYEKQTNTLIPTPSSTSGSIFAKSAYSRTWKDPTTNIFDTTFFSFLLNDAILLKSYQLTFQPSNKSEIPVVIESKSNSQILRGSILEFKSDDDSHLRKAINGFFALNIIGTSRYGENINLTLFTPYPEPNSR